MRKAPYLDKITTSPHIPSVPGQVGYVSVSEETFPDLEHTGVRSKFQPKIIPTVDSHGKVTKIYKYNSNDRVSAVHHEECKMNGREGPITLGHKQFIDKILLDMQETKMLRMSRELRCYRTQKKELGYSSSEFRMEHSTKPVITTTNTRPSTKGSSVSGDEYEESFEEPPEDEERPLQHSALVTSTRAVLPKKKTTKEFNAAKKPPKRVFNRMSLFESLYDSTTNTSPKKRFGTVTSTYTLKDHMEES